jgi:tetratricopeptide (TPR) repeat protein
MRNSSKKAMIVLVGAFAAMLVPPAMADDHVELHAHDYMTAPLLEGMGSWSRPISTRVPLVQRYFDQGLTLAYGFNHAEAERSFLEAARLDPSCAMCFWGAALVLGPNINAPMKDADVPRAFAHMQRALALAPQATPTEQALIEALSLRYAPMPTVDRTPLDRAYADAMRLLAQRFPNDVDILALHAEAQLDLHPWNYWANEGSPHAYTPEIVATLERAMELEPMHPGALHYYIHTMEASPNPERALDAADRLANLVPGAGHLVHMPSHIYIRTGRYHDAAAVNERAIAADERYLPYADPSNFYLHMYRLHNPQFLWAAATLEGRSEAALGAARMVAEMAQGIADSAHGAGMAVMLEHFLVSPLFALIRFGRWKEILQEQAPPEGSQYARAVWHHARAIAYSRLEDQDAAAFELGVLEKLAQEPSLATATVSGINMASEVLAVAVEVTRGELAADRGDLDTAINHFEQAIVLEDKLRYMEPADWHHPTRQILGEVLLRAGRSIDAERVYREDLAKLPENGYSLLGLALALEHQGRVAKARAIRERFAVAFARADVKLKASRF